MEDLMKTTQLLIESQLENELLENVSDYLKEENEQLRESIIMLKYELFIAPMSNVVRGRENISKESLIAIREEFELINKY